MTKRKLSDLVAEAVVIIVSILVAFALDAGWDGFVDRSNERDLLNALQTEFAAAEAELTRARRVHQVRRESAEVLIQIIETQAEVPAHPELARLMISAITKTTVDAPTGVLMSSIGAGSLGLIENDSLKGLLAGWPGRLADHAKSEANIRDWINSVANPWMAERDAFPPLQGATAEWRERLRPILRDGRYRGILWYIHGHTGGVLRENAALAEYMTAVQALLRTSRDGSS